MVDRQAMVGERSALVPLGRGRALVGQSWTRGKLAADGRGPGVAALARSARRYCAVGAVTRAERESRGDEPAGDLRVETELAGAQAGAGRARAAFAVGELRRSGRSPSRARRARTVPVPGIPVRDLGADANDLLRMRRESVLEAFDLAIAVQRAHEEALAAARGGGR
jgi:hypothetical protein